MSPEVQFKIEFFSGSFRASLFIEWGGDGNIKRGIVIFECGFLEKSERSMID